MSYYPKCLAVCGGTFLAVYMVKIDVLNHTAERDHTFDIRSHC